MGSLGGRGGADNSVKSWLLLGLGECEGTGEPGTPLPVLPPGSFPPPPPPPPPPPLIPSCGSWKAGMGECFFWATPVLRRVYCDAPGGLRSNLYFLG